VGLPSPVIQKKFRRSGGGRTKPIDNKGKEGHMRPRILNAPTGWLTVLLVSCLWWGLGCSAQEPQPVSEVTYTFDTDVQDLITILAQKSKDNPYREFDKKFSGLYVPKSLFTQEPFVLGLSTESRIPAILLLTAKWVKRYGEAGWLHEMEGPRSQVKFDRNELMPEVARAFSVAPPDSATRRDKVLMALPTGICGNVLFFREDLLKRYHLKPPRTWDELKAVCRKILPQEKQLKYGLLLQPSRFVDDFYTIFWGFGGVIMDDNRFVLGQVQNQEAFLAALKEVVSMEGSILPAAPAIKQFESEEALQQSFLKGEALFVIHLNYFTRDLVDVLQQSTIRTPGGITKIAGQVGVVPMPSPAGQAKQYTNIDSLGWAVNNFAATAWNARQVMDGVKIFLKLLVNDEYQLQAAESWGEVPSLRSALKKLNDKEVLEVYNTVFAAPNMVIRVPPSSRGLNNIMEKQLIAALYGQQTPEAALQEILRELE
jgi:ABC-type glycerol-3-phosphate transport system substrate-binding protein